MPDTAPVPPAFHRAWNADEPPLDPRYVYTMAEHRRRVEAARRAAREERTRKLQVLAICAVATAVVVWALWPDIMRWIR